MFTDLTEKEKLIYFAGLLDGEGCIKMCRHGGGSRPIVQLQMTCKETVETFANYFDLTIRELKSPSRLSEKWKPLFHCRTECLKAYPIIKALYPYFITKKLDAEIALSYYENRKCLVCETDIDVTKNKKTKYCSAKCRQKAKRKQGDF